MGRLWLLVRPRSPVDPGAPWLLVRPRSPGLLVRPRSPVLKLACLIYRMLKHGQEHVVKSMEEYEAKVKENLLKSLKRKAAAMGFELSPLATD